MAGQRITKRVVDSLKAELTEYAVWDAQMPGFGVKGTPPAQCLTSSSTGRAQGGAPVRRFTIASVGKPPQRTPDSEHRQF